METNQLLQALSDMMDQKLEPIKSELQVLEKEQSEMKSDLQALKKEQSEMKSDLQTLKKEQSEMKSDLQALKKEQSEMKSDLQKQIKRTERTLRAEIVESENLILDEVSRVHTILNTHAENNKLHNIA